MRVQFYAVPNGLGCHQLSTTLAKLRLAAGSRRKVKQRQCALICAVRAV